MNNESQIQMQDVFTGIANGEGMTGFNPQTAKVNIGAVYDTAIRGLKMVDSSIHHFFLYLKSFWYSPNAVDFYNEHAEYIFNLMRRAEQNISDICEKATLAYNIHAQVNGLPQITFDKMKTIYLENSCYTKLEPISPDGVVGMNKYYVPMLISDFKEDMVKGLNVFSSVPMTIDLFDPGSIQREAFAQTIKQMSDSIYSELTSMANIVGRQIETEIDGISRASDEAIVALRGY